MTRRDELVLKRLRTGEASDADILLSIALPGAGIGVLVSLLALPLASLVGLDAPTAPLLYVVMVVGSAVMFSALAFWTAAWTRTAEAAQLTSAPVLVLASVGPFIDLFPSEVARWLALTPGGILDDLAGRTWSGDGFVETWTASGESLLALLGWTVLAVWLAARTMRWEPRA